VHVVGEDRAAVGGGVARDREVVAARRRGFGFGTVAPAFRRRQALQVLVPAPKAQLYR
jgi:hypothetical protein